MEIGLLEELEANTDKEGLSDEARYNHVNEFRFFTSNEHATMYRDTSSSNSLPGSPSANLDEDEHTAVAVAALPGDLWVRILAMHGTMQCICVARLRRVSRAFRGYVDKTLRLSFMNSPLLQARMELRIAPRDTTLNCHCWSAHCQGYPPCQRNHAPCQMAFVENLAIAHGSYSTRTKEKHIEQ
jgi:hypothetical protein